MRKQADSKKRLRLSNIQITENNRQGITLEIPVRSMVYIVALESFYTFMLLIGVSPGSKTLSESLSLIQTHIEKTVVNWFSPLNLSKYVPREVMQQILRVFPQWCDRLNDPIVIMIDQPSLRGLEQIKFCFSKGLPKAIPRELMSLIEKSFIQRTLTDPLIVLILKQINLTNFKSSKILLCTVTEALY